MYTQVQEEGSYRSPDVVEVLEWMLPQAHSPDESMIVMLDWFSGHLTEEVAECVQRKGHVLLFHGGGTTPFTQVNDTHLHATLQKLLVEFENALATAKRNDMLSKGVKRMPTAKREDLIDIVQHVWMAIEHDRVAEKAYKQTGPLMPLEGPVAPEDVYADLLQVIQAIDPTSTSTEVALSKLREDSIDYVNKLVEDGILKDWKDAHILIEPQDEEDPGLAEGLEAFEEAPHGDDYDDDDKEVDEDDAGDGEGDGKGDDDDDGSDCKGDGADDGDDCKSDEEDDAPDDDADADDSSESEEGSDDDGHAGGGSLAHSPVAAKKAALEYTATSPAPEEDSDDGHAGGGSLALSPVAATKAPKASSEAISAKDVLAATQLLIEDAKRNKDDVALKFLQARLSAKVRESKESATEVTRVLRKRALEQCIEDRKRAKEWQEEERLQSMAANEVKIRKAEQDEKTHEANRKLLEQKLINKQAAAVVNRAKLHAKAFQRWVQTTYPAILADECISFLKNMSKDAKKTFGQTVHTMFVARRFERTLHIPDLWTSDKTLTKEWARVKCYSTDNGGKAVRSVRCGDQFAAIIDREAGEQKKSRNTHEMFKILFDKCVPHGHKIFEGNMQPLKLLHMNDYVIEKAFVYAVISLSKWMGKDMYPCASANWPPKAPDNLLAVGPDVVLFSSTTGSSAGLPASSSSGLSEDKQLVALGTDAG